MSNNLFESSRAYLKAGANKSILRDVDEAASADLHELILGGYLQGEQRASEQRLYRPPPVVTVRHVPGETNPADLFVNGRQIFERHRKTVLNLPADAGMESIRRTSGWTASSQRHGTSAT